MLPQYNEKEESPTNPSMGSFSANKEISVSDSLHTLLESRLKQEIPAGSSQGEIERILKEKNTAQELLAEMNNRQAEPIKEVVAGELPTKKISDGIKHPSEKLVTVLQTEKEQLQSEIERLKAELNKKTTSMSETPVAEEIKNNDILNEIEPIQNIEEPKPESIEPKQIKEKVLLTEFVKKDFYSNSSTENKEGVPKIITSEMINALPSEAKDTRILRMPKTSTARPRIINGKTTEERMETLLKKEIPKDDLIDTALEKIANLSPDVTKVFEKIPSYSYERAGKDAEKLLQIIGDNKKFILKVLSAILLKKVITK